MVLKKNGNMRMCIDFTELNKACPKDPYPLPRIDVIIDQAADCDMLSLLDCFSGYHQVWMRREDEAKTGFTTPSASSASSGCQRASATPGLLSTA
jgi:hypothetical protein